jgi:hypothetical protein
LPEPGSAILHGHEPGALRYLWIGVRRAPLWQLPVPLIGMAFLGYTIYKQVHGQSFPYNRFPWVVAGWLVFSLVVVLAAPGSRAGSATG